MADHIHLFVADGGDFELGLWVPGLKRVVAAAVVGGRGAKDSAAATAAARTMRATSQPSRSSLVGGLWKRGFFDRLIRNTESYAQKWEYVRENPVRAGLVQRAGEWAFQGEIVVIDHV